LSWAGEYFKEVLSTYIGKRSRDEKRRIENKKRGSQPFEKGREPISAIDSLNQLFGNFRWSEQVEKATLFTSWEEIVGSDSAAASQPEEISGNKLIVRCRSTAWATQLRLLHDPILAKLQERYVDLGITEIRFVGPQAPSWKKGPRSVPGRGPRDTYG
jgi:predicted nucleic acid-binding Zn ribbon protein